MTNETYTLIKDEVSVKVSASAPESLRTKRIKRTGVRLYQDGYIGISGFMGEEGGAEAAKRALAALGYKIPYPCQPSGGLKRSARTGGQPFTPEALEAEVTAILAVLTRDFPQFVFSSPFITSGTYTTALKNDAGLDLFSAISRHEFVFLYKLATSSSIMDGAFAYSGEKYDRQLFLSYAAEVLGAYLREVPLPAEGRLPVFFEDSEALVTQIFARELDGMTFGAGGSLFSGKAGRKLFAEGLTLYNSRPPDQLPFFDAEGVCADGFNYVENGVLRAPYADKKTALKFGGASSGSAGAEYDGTPTTSPGAMRIRSQARTLKEMMGGQPAVFVAMASGGDFTSEGGFGTPAQVAFLLQDGKLAGRLPQLQLSSGVYEMYGKDFLGVSSDRIMPLSDNRWLGFMLDVRKM
ncbi:MAG TPA: metallopeptidase TldD-related protein [Elusimicrobiales bacterium]|nr:metallopeptidase TldD-related protein [Elusimicrobiales bacterium]